MSQILTSSYKKNVNKKRIFYRKIIGFVVAIILIFLCLAIGLKGNKTSIYYVKNFYIVYADVFTNDNLATQMCTNVADKGGAGVVYQVQNKKYVVVSIYFNIDDANSVKKQTLSIFDTADILKISSAKLSKSVSKKINNCLEAKLYYQELYDFCEQLYSLCINIDKGQIGASEVYKQVITYKQKFNEYYRNLQKKEDKIFKQINNSIMLELSLINKFLDDALIANAVVKNIKKLYVNSIFEFIDMSNSVKYQ